MQWKSEFQLKDLLSTEDKEPNAVRVVADTAVTRLAQTTCFSPRHRARLLTAFKVVQDQDGLNAAMDELYDVADIERVWIK